MLATLFLESLRMEALMPAPLLFELSSSVLLNDAGGSDPRWALQGACIRAVPTAVPSGVRVPGRARSGGRAFADLHARAGRNVKL